MTNSELLIEAMKQNFENARQFEDKRLKYAYYYFGAIAGLYIYISGSLYINISGSSSNTGIDIINNLNKFFNDPSLVSWNHLISLTLILLVYALIGSSTFFYINYINTELKNAIRINQFIARDLGYNIGIEKYRTDIRKDKFRLGLFSTKTCKNIEKILPNHERATYLALPLQFKIRQKMPLLRLTAVAASVFYGCFTFYFLAILFKLKWIEMHLGIFIFLPLIVLILAIINHILYEARLVKLADLELQKRDPQNVR